MSSIKIASWNVEWMVGIFGGQWHNWVAPTIPDTFPGAKLGDIDLDPITDVHGLCRRIAGVIRDMDPQIIGLLESPHVRTKWKRL